MSRFPTRDLSSHVVNRGYKLALTEGQATDASKSCTVRLAAQPTADVTVTITSADTGLMAGDACNNTLRQSSKLSIASARNRNQA